MFKSLLVLSIFVTGSAFAQDMSTTERYSDAFTIGRDGYAVYVGKCTTHEDYEGKFFSDKKIIQDYIVPNDLNSAQIKALFQKLGKNLMAAIFKATNLEDFRSEGESNEEAFSQYIDDISVKTINYPSNPSLNLVSVSYGVGGGNGGVLVLNKTKKASSFSYQVVSETFDKDVKFCDKKVWMK